MNRSVEFQVLEARIKKLEDAIITLIKWTITSAEPINVDEGLEIIDMIQKEAK